MTVSGVRCVICNVRYMMCGIWCSVRCAVCVKPYVSGFKNLSDS